MTTAAVVAYYSQESKAKISYAGHPPVFYRRAGDKAWSYARPPKRKGQSDGFPLNIPLAIDLDTHYGQLTISMAPGDRLFVSKRIVGVFKLADTPQNQDIVMIATGTGLAPYLSFLRSYLTDRPKSKMTVIQGAAKQWDLGYYSELSFLDSSFDNFTYIPTLPEADQTWTGYKLWIDDLLEQDVLMKETGIEVDPDNTHFFLCGNPKMVEGVSNWLKDKGYSRHTRKEPGALHIEEFYS